jgi:molybdate transport system substrate-binding protein
MQRAIMRKAAIAALFFLPSMTSFARAQSDPKQQLTVFAAVSLKTALDALSDPIKASTGHPVRFVYAASHQLARQIEQGAPADIFISADTDWMDFLQTRKLIQADTRFDLLSNRLVMIAHAQTPAPSTIPLTREALLPLLGPRGRLAIAEVRSVPAGRYAKAALVSLNLWQDLESHLVQAENPRAALTYVARGEAPLGIVYASDATSETGATGNTRVRVVAMFPESSHPKIIYPAAVVANRSVQMQQASNAMLAFLRTPQAAVIFAANGFVLPEPR